MLLQHILYYPENTKYLHFCCCRNIKKPGREAQKTEDLIYRKLKFGSKLNVSVQDQDVLSDSLSTELIQHTSDNSYFSETEPLHSL